MRARLRKKLIQKGERLRAYYEAMHIPYFIEESSVFKKNQIHALLYSVKDIVPPEKDGMMVGVFTEKHDSPWWKALYANEKPVVEGTVRRREAEGD